MACTNFAAVKNNRYIMPVDTRDIQIKDYTYELPDETEARLP